MPWPIAHRDMLVRYSGQYDSKNRAVLSVVKSLSKDKFFGLDIPKPENGLVKMDIIRGYNYFQYIDENTTRFMGIFNADPHLAYVPDWLINHMASKICYDQLGLVQQYASKFKESEYY